MIVMLLVGCQASDRIQVLVFAASAKGVSARNRQISQSGYWTEYEPVSEPLA